MATKLPVSPNSHLPSIMEVKKTMAFNLTWKYGKIPKNEINEMTDEMTDDEWAHATRVIHSDGSSILIDDEMLEAYGSEELWRLINN